MSQGRPSGKEREAWDDADPRPSEARVETLAIGAGDGVEHEKCLAGRARLGLRVFHEWLRDAALAGVATHQELRDLASVRLIRRQRE